MGRAARVKLLRACGLAVGRLLKKGSAAAEGGGRGDRLVLAAKVFVLGRLLVSSLGDVKSQGIDGDGDGDGSTVEAARKNLDSLRRRLVRAVEKMLQKVGGEEADVPDIVKALSAYSLASSSGTRDVLRRFLHIRAEAITYEFDGEDHAKDRDIENVSRGLKLYTRTLLDVQALIPNKLPDALASLKKSPLLSDESLRALEGLRLDIYERWCGDEIRYFTPFIRHDDLDGRQAKEMLMSWAKNGQTILLQGLSKTVEHVSEFKAIVELRTKVLQEWIKDGGRAKGFDPSDMLDGLREAINKHLLQLVETKVARLKLVGSEVAAALEAWQAGSTDQQRSLWDEETLEMDMSHGASQVTHEILSRLHGRNDAVARAVTGFESWHQIIDNVGDLVEQLKRQRWDNDVDEIEAEDVIEARQRLLSRDDPQLLHDRLDASLERAFGDLDEHLSALWQGRRGRPDDGPIAMYLLRILRDIRSKLPPKLDSVRAFGLDKVPSLHERLAAHVSLAPVEEYASTALARKRVVGRALWEGEPALPAQPSPGVFALLRNVVVAMGDVGIDLWAPAAVRTFKRVFGEQLVVVWRKELHARRAAVKVRPDDDDDETAEVKEPAADEEESSSSKEEEGEAGRGGASGDDDDSPRPAEQQNKDVAIQWLYDLHLLRHCLDDSAEEAVDQTALVEFTEEVAREAGLGREAEAQLIKASQEYWKRTSLLFGLLAP
ncbi:hypothetical protein GGR56DRAFT_625454 [Xylariaceae sp. FL0804]|nr:hypothetical protein GGR56DRAFT_625454 [Xylariaceae sp. FL0804]